MCAGNPKIELMGGKGFGEMCLFLGSTLISLSGEEDIWLKCLSGMWTSPGIRPPPAVSEERGGSAGHDGESQRKNRQPRRRWRFARAHFRQSRVGKHNTATQPTPPPPPFPNILLPPSNTTSHPTLRLTAPGTRRLKRIFNLATLKWHSSNALNQL